MGSITKDNLDEIRRALKKKKHGGANTGESVKTDTLQLGASDDDETPSLNVRHVTIHNPHREAVQFELATGRKKVVKFEQLE